MREIKFRAWDKQTNQYWDFQKQRSGVQEDGYIVLDHDGKVLMAEIGGLRDVSERFEIEQYTGLKNKNGRKIYEGDIVREYIGLKPKKPRLAICKWHKTRWLLLAPGANPVITNLSSFERGEVIGNIHENPELLKGETR